MKRLKKIYILLVAAALAASCSSDDIEVFGVKPTGGFEFIPTPGGAIMKYSLPSNTDIKEVRARYTDVNGKEIIVAGSYLSKEMTLVGFNEARTNVPVFISYINKNGLASEEYQTTFNTGDSGAYAFFKNAQVKAAWNGFEVSYDLPEDGMTGFAHVFYVGVNPNTQKTDTLLISTITLGKGKASKFYTLQQDISETTVIIKTEDFRGYFVKQQQWEHVTSYSTKLYDPSNLTVECESSIEDDTQKLGVKYLTDGDLKGYQALSAKGDIYYTFAMGPYAFGKDIIVDMGTPQVPAAVRVYAQFFVKVEYYEPVWHMNYVDTLPCEVEVYGSNDKENWEMLSSYSEPANGSGANWYAKGHVVTSMDPLTKEQLDNNEPVFLEVAISVSDDSYRYLRVVPVKTFDTNTVPTYKNNLQNVTMQELEVYVKK